MLEHATHAPPWTLDGDREEYPAESRKRTPLDPLETSGFGPDNLSQTFRHSGWVRQRRLVYEALREAGCSPASRDAFAYCGSTCFVLQAKNDPTNLKLAASCCHGRFCKPCANARSRTIAMNVAQYLDRGQCRFVTLTLKHNNRPLAENIHRLYAGFKTLRKGQLWKSTQRGGVAFLEIKRSRDRQSWHPHFHVLTQGKWIDGQKLSNAWKHITTDSFIVDVRIVNEQKTVIEYVTKYASKPFDPTLYENQPTLVEAIKALEGRRMALTFGNWKGLQMTEKPDKEAWEFLDTLEGLCRRAAMGDNQARAIIVTACGRRGIQLIEEAGKQVVPRMNVGRPPTPDPALYLFDGSIDRPTMY